MLTNIFIQYTMDVVVCLRVQHTQLYYYLIYNILIYVQQGDGAKPTHLKLTPLSFNFYSRVVKKKQ